MNLQELEHQLRTARVRPDSYSLDGTPKEDALILEPPSRTGWIIYYSERGFRKGEKIFVTEKQACNEFLAMALRDPRLVPDRAPERRFTSHVWPVRFAMA